MNSWLVPLAELTPAQLRAVKAKTDQHQLIYGLPGTGKTQLLLHRARYLCDTFFVPPHQFRIIVSSNIMKGYLRAGLSLLNLPEGSVTTFDSWTLSYYRHAISSNIPQNGNQIDFNAMRRVMLQRLPKRTEESVFDILLQPVLNMFRNNSPSLPLFNFLMVDEAQAFDRDSLQLLLALARHVTMVVDDGPLSGNSTILTELQQLGPRRSLLSAFRSSPFIINLAAQLIDDPITRQNFIQASVTKELERETPTLYFAQYEREERERLIEVLRNRLVRGESIAILLPREDQLDAFAERLKDPRIILKRLRSDARSDGSFNLSDFNDDSPKLLSYEDARGLSFDTVLLPNLTTKTFTDIPEPEIKKLIFSGITRAAKWVFMSTRQGQELPALRSIIALSSQGLINIQQANSSSYPEIVNTNTTSEPDLTDIL